MNSNSKCPDNNVVKVEMNEYNEAEELHKNDELIIYRVASETHPYEVVLYFKENLFSSCHTETSKEAEGDLMFSLYRTDTLEEAKEKLHIYEFKLPFLTTIIISNEWGTEHNIAREIQKLCNTLTKHPTWTLAHFVANCRLLHLYFEKSEIFKDLYVKDPETGSTPIHIAAQRDDYKLFQLMTVDKNDLSENLDYKENTLYHYAAKGADERVILELERLEISGINDRNADGKTPLDIANKKKSGCKRAIKEILEKLEIDVTDKMNSE